MYYSTSENVRKRDDSNLPVISLRHVRREEELGIRTGGDAGNIGVLPAVWPEAAVYSVEIQLAPVHRECAELLGVSPDRQPAGGDVLRLCVAPGEPQRGRGPAAAEDRGRDASYHEPGGADAEADGQGTANEHGAAGEDGGVEETDRQRVFDNHGERQGALAELKIRREIQSPGEPVPAPVTASDRDGEGSGGVPEE